MSPRIQEFPQGAFTEALLEMHFHRAIVEAFAEVFGRRVFRILKPSPQHERFLGFDQAWVKNSVLTDMELRNQLRRAIEDGGSTGQRPVFIGYFLQFKRVTVTLNRSEFTPDGYGRGSLRSELDLKTPRKSHWKWSQHETLVRLQLALGPRSEVSYACPMIFDTAAIYDEPKLECLRFVPVATAPTFANDERHFIYFRHANDPEPCWCSEPVPGKSLSFKEWIKSFRKLLTANELLKLLEQQGEVMSDGTSSAARFRYWEIADQLTIVEFAHEQAP